MFKYIYLKTAYMSNGLGSLGHRLLEISGVIWRLLSGMTQGKKGGKQDRVKREFAALAKIPRGAQLALRSWPGWRREGWDLGSPLLSISPCVWLPPEDKSGWGSSPAKGVPETQLRALSRQRPLFFLTLHQYHLRLPRRSIYWRSIW